MRGLVLLACCGVAACDLQEITLAESDDVVVAEITLRAGDSIQTAFLHRTLQNGANAPVANARIEVTNEAGNVLSFAESAPADCLLDSIADAGTCYRSTSRSYAIVPGARYALRIETSQGEILTGATRVPDDFTLVRPAVVTCALAAMTTFTIEWSSSPGAWVYISEITISGLKPFLASRDIELKEDPLRLYGLSLSNRDTTVVFPTEFGLFQRFDPDLTKVLVAIQNGLPAGASADVTIAAADRNYVNWERGGNFNPSGLVRVPSIFGNGTGTFGSIVPKPFTVVVAGAGPAC